MADSQDLCSDQRPVLRRLAAAHLPADVAERWLRLARPAVHLLTPDDAGDDPAYDTLPLAGRLGGTPQLPPGFPWPVWEGHGPLPLVAEIDLGAVAAAGLDPGIALPRSASPGSAAEPDLGVRVPAPLLGVLPDVATLPGAGSGSERRGARRPRSAPGCSPTLRP